MKKSVKVSIVVPVYNAYRFLPAALDSLCAQTLKEIEIICVDDGSTDRSYDVLRNYQKKDSRIIVLMQANSGVGNARNTGFQIAQGEYVLFFDADDYMEKGCVEALYRMAKKDRLDVAICGYNLFQNANDKFIPPKYSIHEDIFADGVVTSKNEFPDTIFQGAIGAAWNKLFRADFLREKEIHFLPDVHIFEDTYFTFSALSLAERVEKNCEIFVHHRVYSDQLRSRAFRRYYDEIPGVFLALKEFLRQNGMYAPLSTSFLNLTSDICFRVFNMLFYDGQKAFWTRLRGGDAEELGWYGHTPEKFESDEVARFVASLELFSFEQFEVDGAENIRNAILKRRKREVLMYGRNRLKAIGAYIEKFLSKFNKEKETIVSDVPKEEAEPSSNEIKQ